MAKPTLLANAAPNAGHALTADTLHIWPMLEDTGTANVVRDVRELGSDVDLTVVPATGSGWQQTTEPYGYTMVHNNPGNQSYMEDPTYTWTRQVSFSIGVRFRVDAHDPSSTRPSGIIWNHSFSTAGIRITVERDNTITCIIGDSSNARREVTGIPYVVGTDGWANVVLAFRYNGTSGSCIVTAYKNGVAYAQTNAASDSPGKFSAFRGSIYCGRNEENLGAGIGFNGEVDTIYIFSKELDQTDVDLLETDFHALYSAAAVDELNDAPPQGLVTVNSTAATLVTSSGFNQTPAQGLVTVNSTAATLINTISFVETPAQGLVTVNSTAATLTSADTSFIGTPPHGSVIVNATAPVKDYFINTPPQGLVTVNSTAASMMGVTTKPTMLGDANVQGGHELGPFVTHLWPILDGSGTTVTDIVAADNLTVQQGAAGGWQTGSEPYGFTLSHNDPTDSTYLTSSYSWTRAVDTAITVRFRVDQFDPSSGNPAAIIHNDRFNLSSSIRIVANQDNTITMNFGNTSGWREVSGIPFSLGTTYTATLYFDFEAGTITGYLNSDEYAQTAAAGDIPGDFGSNFQNGLSVGKTAEPATQQGWNGFLDFIMITENVSTSDPATKHMTLERHTEMHQNPYAVMSAGVVTFNASAVHGSVTVNSTPGFIAQYFNPTANQGVVTVNSTPAQGQFNYFLDATPPHGVVTVNATPADLRTSESFEVSAIHGSIAVTSTAGKWGGTHTKFDGVTWNDEADFPIQLAELVTDVPANEGTLTFYENAAFVFDFDPEFAGNSTSFTYRIFDGSAYSDPATVTISAASEFVANGVSGSVTVNATAATGIFDYGFERFATQGAVDVLSTPASLVAGFAVESTKGSVTVNGKVATLTNGYSFNGSAVHGAVAVNSTAASLLAGFTATAINGQITVNGKVATLSSGASFTGIAISGSVQVNSTPATLTVSESFVGSGVHGSVSVVSSTPAFVNFGATSGIDDGAIHIEINDNSINEVASGSFGYVLEIQLDSDVTTASAQRLEWTGADKIRNSQSAIVVDAELGIVGMVVQEGAFKFPGAYTVQAIVEFGDNASVGRLKSQPIELLVY